MTSDPVSNPSEDHLRTVSFSRECRRPCPNFILVRERQLVQSSNLAKMLGWTNKLTGHKLANQTILGPRS